MLSVPLCILTIRATIAKPKPEPCVVRADSPRTKGCNSSGIWLSYMPSPWSRTVSSSAKRLAWLLSSMGA